MRRRWLVPAILMMAVGCGDDSSGLDNYYPELPPEGGATGASTGVVTDVGQLIPGPAQSGMVGDFYIKNDVVSFIVQAPTRVIGVVPQGGNVVDAAFIDANGQLSPDHFGELSLVYLVGRTCEHDRMEIVRDGSKGGAAVLRAIGRSGNNDFINLKGFGAVPVVAAIDPDISDDVLCATTYVLAPGSTAMEVYFSLFNDGKEEISGPFGTLADTGGNTWPWTNTRGFETAALSALTSLGNPSPMDYVVYQGPGVAYGLIPRHAIPVTSSHVVISGVSVFLIGNSYLLEVLQRDKWYLRMQSGKGYLQRFDLSVGRDASRADAVWRTGETPRTITGRVDWSGGGGAAGARVGIFEDTNGNGQVDEAGSDADANFIPDDHAVSYIDVNADGTFAGTAPAAGNLLLRAEVKNQGRSQVMPLADTVNLTIPSPIKVDYEILDADTGQPMPGRVVAIGTHPAFPDKRLFELYDRASGIVDHVDAIRGTTTDVGDGVDPALYLPAGGTYRVFATRGTEWSVASYAVSGTASVNLSFDLKHVVPTPNYVASDWHVHQVGSPDSPVLHDDRIRSVVAAGVEVFAATDHDYVSDLQPTIVELGLTNETRAVPGIEVTPFAYGHFNAWPLLPDDSSPNKGAIDWARGVAGYSMLPAEIYAAMRERGAQMVQVNHPRDKGIDEFQAVFSRANVKYDWDGRTIFGDYENASTPNEWLRLPEQDIWSDQFNALEVWNGFTIQDSNQDMLRENKSLDRVMRDWLSMLSMGFYVTPFGNSDTHMLTYRPLGMPRTYVRVPDDSAAAIANGSILDAVLRTQTGAAGTPRDVVVTNGPMIDVRVNNAPVLGTAVTSVNQPVTFTVSIIAADWAEVDTLEVFANSTPDPLTSADITALIPLKCWTTRDTGTLNAKDPCAQASLAPDAMTVSLATLPGGGGFKRYEATVQITLDKADITTRTGRTGEDAWFVFRARGDRAILPVLTDNAVDDTTLPAILGGDMTAIAAALKGRGVPATAFTAPVFVDFDGGGYRAPFAP